MRHMSRAATVAMLVVLFSSAQFAVAAVTIDADFQSQLANDDVSVELFGSGFHTTGDGGPFDWATTGSNPPGLKYRTKSGGSSTTEFVGFCLELTQNLLTGPETLTVIDLSTAPIPGSNNNPMGSYAADLMKNLWYQYFPSTIGSSLNSAAFQMAIWELVYDEGTIDLSTAVSAGGNQFRSSQAAAAGNVTQVALNMLNSLNANGPKANLVGLTKFGPDGIKNAAFQDQVIEIVPEPASVLAWSLIGGCFVVGHRIRRNRMIVG